MMERRHNHSDHGPTTRLGLALGPALVSLTIMTGSALAEPQLSVSPVPVIENGQVTLRAAGLPALTVVEIGAGPPFSEYTVMDTARTDAHGMLTCTVGLPQFAEPGMYLVFAVATTDFATKALSEPVAVVSQVMATADQTQTAATPGSSP